MFDWPLIFWREKRLVSVIQVELAFVLGNRVSRPGSQWFFTRSGLRPQERLCKCQPREHYMSVLKLEKSGRTLPTFWKWNKHDGVISGLSQISERIDAQIGTIWYRQTTTSHSFLRETKCRKIQLSTAERSFQGTFAGALIFRSVSRQPIWYNCNIQTFVPRQVAATYWPSLLLLLRCAIASRNTS